MLDKFCVGKERCRDVAALESRIQRIQTELDIAKSNAKDNADAMYREIAKNAWLESQLRQARAENEKLKSDWQYFKESIAPLIECEPCDIQDMSYILNSVAVMQEEERNYSGISDELVELEAENAALRADNAGLVLAIKDLGNSNWTPTKIAVKEKLLTPHPGASLLQELKALRVVKKSMEWIKDQYESDFTEDELTEMCPRDEAIYETVIDALAAAKGAD